uniref:carboxypeptidase regulatory-like domain-containing protein n=1 Tax=Alistipes shahii TaxID=328814 RepID=UPI003FEDBD85
MTAASAQTQTVKGRVVDENNAPVIGATVVVKNRPTIGTSTDVKGEFALQGVPKGGTGSPSNSAVCPLPPNGYHPCITIPIF